MKILVDATGVVSSTTGVGQYSVQLLNAIGDIDEHNDYTVLLQKRLRKDHKMWGLRGKSNFALREVNIPSVGPKKQLVFPWMLGRSQVRYDLLHSLNSELPLLHDMNSVVTIHDLKYLRYHHLLKGASQLKAMYLKRIMRSVAKKARKIIAVSRSTRRDIVMLLGVEESKIEVIHEASNLASYSPAGCEDNGSRYSTGLPYFLCVAERRPHKNLEGLMEAFAIFKRRYDKWGTSLVLVGKEYSRHEDSLVDAKYRDIQGDVTITGFVPDEDLRVLYGEAEIFLLVSFYEGFGIPILEAMDCGTPVITSNISSMPEVAGDAAILVDPHDPEEIARAMLAIMGSRSLRDELVQKGYARARVFSWEETARQTLEVYEKVWSA